MRFAQLMQQYTKGRTLDGIASDLQARGFRIHRVNLSMFRSGARKPPKDENLVRAIADVCNCDPAPLINLARLERGGDGVVASVLSALGTDAGDPEAIAQAIRRVMVPPTPPSEDVLVCMLAQAAGVPEIGLRAALAAMKTMKAVRE